MFPPLQIFSTDRGPLQSGFPSFHVECQPPPPPIFEPVRPMKRLKPRRNRSISFEGAPDRTFSAHTFTRASKELAPHSPGVPLDLKPVSSDLIDNILSPSLSPEASNPQDIRSIREEQERGRLLSSGKVRPRGRRPVREGA